MLVVSLKTVNKNEFVIVKCVLVSRLRKVVPIIRLMVGVSTQSVLSQSFEQFIMWYILYMAISVNYILHSSPNSGPIATLRILVLT